MDDSVTVSQEAAAQIGSQALLVAGAVYSLEDLLHATIVASANDAACVIGGVSFVGGTGKISGIVVGVLLLQIIFAGLNFLSVSANMLYICLLYTSQLEDSRSQLYR